MQVEMVRQNNHGVDLKRIGRHHSFEGGSQQVNSGFLIEQRPTFAGRDGEEEYTALQVSSSVIWHWSLVGLRWWVNRPFDPPYGYGVFLTHVAICRLG